MGDLFGGGGDDLGGSSRPEMKGPDVGVMKGPTDISDILSGLKTKQSTVQSNMQPNFKKVTEASIPTVNLGASDTISIKKDEDAKK